jgi:hypothetical protein
VGLGGVVIEASGLVDVTMSTLRGPGVTEVAGPTLAWVLIETMI